MQPNANKAWTTNRLLYGAISILTIAIGVSAYLYLMHTPALVGFDQRGEPNQVAFVIETGLLALATMLTLLCIVSRYSIHEKDRGLIEMRAGFLAVVSHEVRSPLASMRWSLSALRADASLTPSARDIVNDLYRRVCAAIDLTSTLLETTSIDYGILRTEDLKLIDIAPVITEAVANAQAIALPKRISVKVENPPQGHILVKGDAGQLRLVFDNLLSNAIKYSKEDSLILFNYVDRHSSKIFMVQDQGIGIPENEIKNIFSGFHRAKNAKRPGVPGSGFGLYMARKIIQLHGGNLTCNSVVNKGTMFTVSLPSGV